MDYIVPVFSRRVEAEDFLQLVQEFAARPFGDAHSAIALNVRVSSHRDDARAGPANVSAQKQQVHDLLHVLSAATVLGNTHAIAGHDIFGLKVNLSRLF